TDTILFNIDSKADHRAGREALLQVFLKVLNEMQGYSGDHPHIAHMERHLDEKGKLKVFSDAFEREAGSSWHQERDAWEFHRDAVVAALREALGQSEESVEAWVDGAESNFSLTVENFAKWVKRYLDTKQADQRIMFLVDEVGQFIGDDTHLMLNLQTITEQLATVCEGRAWVVVTSQEDLDVVLGDLKNHKQHDFSKIQGRFKTRLSLSSENVDEVIKRRLLDKNDEAKAPLNAAYDGKHDILQNQLSFINAGMSFKKYNDEADFAACYPFAAYQFTLVQKVFESIRKAGATGLHLSEGERSTLDAFQSAARELSEEDIGKIVPFYRFYPAVEGFLDTTVKRTISQASENHALEPFDSLVLQLLFLIRYIEELPGSVDNLVTLCVDEIDADRLSLRKTIEASLMRLEGETLISRNGDLYFFLTNEERDIGREIKDQRVPSGAEERELGKLLFLDILDDARKHTYSLTQRDFAYTRLCDDHPVGNRLDGSLDISFVSPLGDSYADFTSNEACAMHTNQHEARVLIRLPDESNLGSELRTYLQTESYVKTKHTGSLPETTKRILRDRIDDNRGRRARIIDNLKEMLAGASYFASGTKLDISSSAPKDALAQALEYLIKNAYPKMAYISHLHSNPKAEIQTILRADDVEQVTLALNTPEGNPQALNDLREYIKLSALTSKQVVLYELIEKRYGQRPYGWPEIEVVLLVARLAVLKEITLVFDSAPLALDKAYEKLTSSAKQRKVIIRERAVAGTELIKNARDLGKDLFEQ
ncbi:BREX system P-loop protein BrxC, partial [Myxococcota bacterium]|nr:BREX system P-loop protein BrxC [Myxococcota bacterium]